MLQVKWVRKRPSAKIPVFAHEGDAGFDLAAAEDAVVAPFQKRIISTGLKVEIPKGFELQVRPRSGFSAKSPITIANSPGTIDSNYRGEVGVIVHHIPFIAKWQILLFALGLILLTSSESAHYIVTIIGVVAGVIAASPLFRSLITPYTIRQGDRIAQGVICALPAVEHTEIVESELSATTRGEGGFGSTGNNGSR